MRLKFNPLRSELDGKRLVVVDDSIVRGTTTRKLVHDAARGGRARGAPAHLLAADRSPCFYGIDMADQDELLAADLTVEEIRATWARHRSPTCRSTASAGHRRAGRGLLQGLPDRRLPDRDPRRHAARQAALRVRAGRRWRSGERERAPLTYAGAGVNIDAGEAAVERIKRPSPRPRPRGPRRRTAASPGCSRRSVGDPLLVGRHRRRRHQGAARARRPAAADARHRPGGHVRQRRRHRGAEPRFFLDCITCGRARPRPDRAAGRGRRRRLPPGRLRPARRRDGRAPRHDGARATSTWPASASASSERARAHRRRPRRAGRRAHRPAVERACARNGYSLARRLLERAGLGLDDAGAAGRRHRWPTSCSSRR